MDPMEECSEENEQQSCHSPGTVGDEESLARVIWRGDHLAEDGELAPAAFPTQDFLDRSRGGLSVARLEHMMAHESQWLGALLGAGSGKRLKGMAVAGTDDVRAIRTDGARAFCVVDDGTADFRAHAAIRLARERRINRSSVRRVRHKLMQVFSFRPSD